MLSQLLQFTVMFLSISEVTSRLTASKDTFRLGVFHDRHAGCMQGINAMCMHLACWW